MTEGKRLKPVTIHMQELMKLAVERIAKNEGRTTSTWLLRKVASDPTVQIVLREIEQSRVAR
jgi:hypothetical protein